MYLGEIKDIVREHFGRTGIPTFLVDLALKESRKLIEKEANFWWMEDEADFVLTANQDTYEIGPDSSTITIPNFKDAQFLVWRDPGDVSYEPVALGTKEKSELDLLYDTDDEGSPEAACIKGNTLFVYPPQPDEAYEMRLYYYGYSTAPTSNIEDPAVDELYNNWGLTLVYGALVWGYEIELKDLNGAGYWRGLFAQDIKALKRLNLKRGWKSQIELIPKTGPGISHFQRLSNQQIYPRR